jgi:hypothetical protein
MSLWNLFKRAIKKQEFEVQEPNAVLNVGLFNENMRSMKQLPFLIGVSSIDKNDYFDSTLSKETGEGAIFVPSPSNEFYKGEPL